MGVYDIVMRNVATAYQGGIWARSSSSRYCIFCVGQDLIKINAFMSFAVHSEIGIKPLVGMYKGTQERSFIANFGFIKEIKPWLQAEESILILGACNNKNEPKARLVYLETGVEINIGRLRQTTSDIALAGDSWTYDPFTKVHYICT